MLQDFSGFAPAQEKLDINCSTKQQISNDDFFSFDGSAPVQDKLDPHCRNKKNIRDNDEEQMEEQEFGFVRPKISLYSWFKEY